MNRTIICMLVLLVLAAGCVQPQADTAEKEAAPAEEQAAEGSTAKPVIAAETILGEDIGKAIDENLASGMRYLIPVNYKSIAYGNSFIFGVGVQNVMPTSDKYLLSVTFDKAYDKMTNTIDTDSDTMNKWIKTVFEPFDLEPYAKQTAAIKVQVGDIKQGVKPSAGTDVFDVDILNAGGGSFSIRKEYDSAKISIRVE